MSDAAAREQIDTETGATAPGLRVPFSARAHARAASRRLATAVAAKLALDLLFVCALAVYAHAFDFRAAYVGSLEHADARGARGWVVDGEHPGAAVEVQLYVDGRFAGAGMADLPRQDFSAGGSAPDGRRGFDFRLEPLPRGEHEARVYAVRASRGGARRTLQQVGAPLRFVSD